MINRTLKASPIEIFVVPEPRPTMPAAWATAKPAGWPVEPEQRQAERSAEAGVQTQQVGTKNKHRCRCHWPTCWNREGEGAEADDPANPERSHQDAADEAPSRISRQ
jgi:hypothetical protein